MPTMTRRKSFLIASSLVLAAAMISIGQRQNAGIPDRSVAAATSLSALPSCPATRGVDIRTPIYKRYLRRISAGNYTPRQPR